MHGPSKPPQVGGRRLWLITMFIFGGLVYKYNLEMFWKTMEKQHLKESSPSSISDTLNSGSVENLEVESELKAEMVEFEQEHQQDKFEFALDQKRSSEGFETSILKSENLPKPNSNVLRVCTVAFNKRQGSMFRTNLLSKYGTGKLQYYITSPEKCPWNRPRVRLIPFVKCCTTKSQVNRTISNSIRPFDIIIVTGDEYCMMHDPRGHFRQYYHEDFIGQRTLQIPNLDGEIEEFKLPLYIPLGPRSEFERVKAKDLIPSGRQRYLFNFVGSLSSESRKNLKTLFYPSIPTNVSMMVRQEVAFIHTTDRWRHTIKESNGYISPQFYRSVLLDSKFTLCPAGHNPEAYRIYEACEAGSIPILVDGEDYYKKHACNGAFEPFKQANAPFIWLNSWDELENFLLTDGSNETFIAQKQEEVRLWYQAYMQEFARRFETLLMYRFRKRYKKFDS